MLSGFQSSVSSNYREKNLSGDNLQFMNFELHPQSIWSKFMRCYFEMAAAFGVEVDSSVPLDYSH